MKQINKCKTAAYSRNRQGFDNSATCQYRILTRVEFKPGSPNMFSVLDKGKSPPCRSRNPGSSLGGLIRDDVPTARRILIINNKEELFQINYNQYSITIKF